MYHQIVPPVSTAQLQSVPFLDFSRQFGVIGEEVFAAIAAVCASQRFILGPEVSELEASLANLLQVPQAIACGSGTDALWLAFAAAGIGDSAQAERLAKPPAVITTPFSFFASASAILRAGARVIFADIDPLTFNLSPQAVRETLQSPSSAGVRAVLPVHLFGQCANWDAFHSIEHEHPELLLFEDAAQAFGATWNNSPAGALGTAASFSFYPTKNLSAFGDAGMMTTRSSEVNERARSLRSHGMTRRYFHDEVGWNSRMDSIQAAVLTVKLRYIEGWNQRRRELAAHYHELFRQAGLAVTPSPEKPGTVGEGVILPWTHPRAQHVFHQYIVRVPRRDELRESLSTQGIGSEVYYPLCLHEQKALQSLGYRTGDFPEAERAAAEVLALPIYPELRNDEQETVVDAIRRFYA